MTNEERIKAMSTEELAEFMINRDCSCCGYHSEDKCNLKCFSGVYEWLKQEAKE